MNQQTNLKSQYFHLASLNVFEMYGNIIIKQNFYLNFQELKRCSSYDGKCLSIKNAFTWHQTRQGNEYWLNLWQYIDRTYSTEFDRIVFVNYCNTPQLYTKYTNIKQLLNIS